MGPETVLWLEVPYEDVLRFASDPAQAYRSKRHWHEHVNFFTPRSLAALIERVGLEVVDESEFTISSGGCVAGAIGLVCRLKVRQ